MKHNFEQLTFGLGDNNLFNTPYGAYTIADYLELIELYQSKPNKHAEKFVDISDEMSKINEQSVEQYGCSCY